MLNTHATSWHDEDHEPKMVCREEVQYGLREAAVDFSQGSDIIGPFTNDISKWLNVPPWAVRVGGGLLSTIIGLAMAPTEKVCTPH